MDLPVLTVLINSVITGLITGAAAWAAIRVEIKYLRRDIDRNSDQIDELQTLVRRANGEAS